MCLGAVRASDLDLDFYCSLLQQRGPKNFKLSKVELICQAKKFEVPPFTI